MHLSFNKKKKKKKNNQKIIKIPYDKSVHALQS